MVPRKIWLYWEDRPGSRRPPYLDLSLQTIRRHAGDHEVCLLDRKSVESWIDLPPVVDRLAQLAHKADYIRYRLLHDYGGIWLDSDIVLMREIAPAVEIPGDDHDYIGCGIEVGKPSIWFMAAQPGCRLLARQLEAVTRVLAEKERRQPNGKIELRWAEIGYDILWKLTGGYPYHHHPFRQFAPIIWSDWKVFFREDLSVDEYLAHDPFAVMLYNKFMFEPLERVSEQQILSRDWLLSKLYRRSLGL